MNVDIDLIKMEEIGREQLIVALDLLKHYNAQKQK